MSFTPLNSPLQAAGSLEVSGTGGLSTHVALSAAAEIRTVFFEQIFGDYGIDDFLPLVPRAGVVVNMPAAFIYQKDAPTIVLDPPPTQSSAQ